MANTLKLTRYGVVNVNYLWLGAYRLRVEASDPLATGTDPNVFLIKRELPDPETDEVEDTFLGVCSPADMAEYPVGNPTDKTPYPMYRLWWGEIDIRAIGTPEEESKRTADDAKPTAANAWKVIREDVNRLLLSLEVLTRLVVLEEVFVGDPPPAAPSSDSGGSDSISS